LAVAPLEGRAQALGEKMRLRPSQLAEQYIQAFCAGDLEALRDILADDLSFRGPLFEFSSAAAYLESLEEHPLARSDYRILSVLEDGQSAAVFWEYQKSDTSLLLAQLFKSDGERISEIVLVFDPREST